MFNKSSQNKNKLERKFFQAWYSMKHRCSEKSSKKTRKRYFDRGIKVSPRWESFDFFFIDMWDSFLLHSTIYKNDTQLDRIDNNGNYSKINCRWVTKKENCNNRSTRRTFNGKTLSEWSRLLKINRSTLEQRYYVYRWSIEKTLKEINESNSNS